MAGHLHEVRALACVCAQLNPARTLHIVTALSVVAFFWTLIAVFYLRTDPWRIPTQAFLRLDRWWYDVPPRAITKVRKFRAAACCPFQNYDCFLNDFSIV
jgi:hypothetical protein